MPWQRTTEQMPEEGQKVAIIGPTVAIAVAIWDGAVFMVESVALLPDAVTWWCNHPEAAP
jgi:hypothetical protein